MGLATLTLASVALLLAGDAWPRLFPALSHNLAGALPLVLIALAYLTYQVARGPTPAEIAKALLLATAFLFWAANQFWSDEPHATIFNDVAIALFVFDVFLVIAGWPRTCPDEAFAGTYLGRAENEQAENAH